jgi:inosine/xanthosine triphosphatase
MKIAVGSKNQAKLDAVREILQDYSHLKDAELGGVDVHSGVSNQPKSLEETLRGAMNRAKAAHADCDYSIGIESGLMDVPYTKSGYMDVCAVAIYDGNEHHLGLSSGWEFPDPEVTNLMVRDGLDMSEAVNKAGMVDDPAVGSKQGAIGILTRGRLDRKELTKQALRTALIHIDA